MMMASLWKTCLLAWFGATSNASSCDIFLAPSKLDSGGWGVYAAREFEENEVIEIAPLYLTLPLQSAVVKNTVLDDYHYGLYRGKEHCGAVVLGLVMFYNHNQEPNVQWTTNLGKNPDSANVVGMVTKRPISQGEELFSAYGIGDDGIRWFATRRLTMNTPTKESKLASEELEGYRQIYCSKAYAGPGKSTYHDRFKPDGELYLFRTDKLPSVDAPTAIARTTVKKGERLEIAPALVLSQHLVSGTAIAPLVYTWEDLSKDHHEALKDLRGAGQLKLQYQSPDTQWHRLDRFESFEGAVLFPAAGNIGMLERVGSDNPNCGISIKSSGSGEGSAGLALEVFALRDISSGETLRLNIPPTGTSSEKQALVEILASTGQLIPDSLQEARSNKAANEL